LRCVALRCAASGGAGSSVVSGVVSLQRAPVVRHDRRAGQWARDALVNLQPGWSLDADKRGVEPPGSWLELGQLAAPTESELVLAIMRFGNRVWQRRSGRIEEGVKHKRRPLTRRSCTPISAWAVRIGVTGDRSEGCCV
jgi:hypothetical protein